jgi:cysteine desulfurase
MDINISNKESYMDHAATTYMDPKVKEAMDPYFCDNYGNPGSFHGRGLPAQESIAEARAKIAKHLNADPSEIIFTGGGTESINLAIKGVAFRKGKGHIITQKTEHHAVLHTCEYLEKKGFEVTYLPVDDFGMVNPEDVKNAIKEDTILVTIMYANNEVGTIQPIAEIGAICKENNILFHTDACQAAGALDLDVKKLNTDMLTINGSKIYGPKGVGLLYLKKGVRIDALIHGGGQESNMRAGTENVPGIIGLAKALELVQETRDIENARLIKLRDKLITSIMNEVNDTKLNGHPTQRLPNNANISFLGIEGEAMLLLLSEYGIYCSTGSACTSRTLDPSHVLVGMNMPYELAHGSLRFTLGKRTTDADIDYLLKTLPPIITWLRTLSPIKVKMNEIMKRKPVSYRERFA